MVELTNPIGDGGWLYLREDRDKSPDTGGAVLTRGEGTMWRGQCEHRHRRSIANRGFSGHAECSLPALKTMPRIVPHPMPMGKSGERTSGKKQYAATNEPASPRSAFSYPVQYPYHG